MLLDIRDEIPCATEQGINSRQTGNLIRPNRELIRDNRELGTGTEKWLKIDPPARGSACFAPSPKPRGRESRKSRANVCPHSRLRRAAGWRRYAPRRRRGRLHDESRSRRRS